jgi:hypothetical protein
MHGAPIYFWENGKVGARKPKCIPYSLKSKVLTCASGRSTTATRWRWTARPGVCRRARVATAMGRPDREPPAAPAAPMRIVS